MVERGALGIDEILPFINKTFKEKFKTLLPKIYSSNKYQSYHYSVRENGKILGITAAIPAEIAVYDRKLSARGIGMVSTAKKARGRGIMSAMVKRAIADAEKENVDFMFLSGNRQRYEYFGFVPAGYKYTFTLLKHNVKHMKRKLSYSFVRVSESSPELDKIIACYNESDVRFIREDFYNIVSSWRTKELYAIINASGKVIGHIAKKWWKIVDFNTVEPQNSAYIIKAFMEFRHLPTVKTEIYPSAPKVVRDLSAYFEYPEASSCCNIKILNYRNVIETLLYMQSKEVRISDFDINILIGNELINVTSKENEPKAISLGKLPPQNAEATAVKTPSDIEIKTENGDIRNYRVDYAFSEKEAAISLFSAPLSAHNGLPFSLPIFVTFADNV